MILVKVILHVVLIFSSENFKRIDSRDRNRYKNYIKIQNVVVHKTVS